MNQLTLNKTHQLTDAQIQLIASALLANDAGNNLDANLKHELMSALNVMTTQAGTLHFSDTAGDGCHLADY